MAKYRQIYTEFWSDSFVFELAPEEKFFYLYLLTNTKSSQSGIYEISPKFIATETGYGKELVEQLLKKFCDYKKILYCETTNEIMVLNWITYNLPNNNNAVIGIQKQLLRVKNKAFLKILFEKCKVAELDVDNIFKGLIVNDTPTNVTGVISMNLENIEAQSNNIIALDATNELSETTIIKPLGSPLVAATKPHPSNRVRNKEKRLINKEEAVINKHEVITNEKVMTKEVVIPKSENPAAEDGEGMKTIIKIFEKNVHAITPFVYEKILGFTKHVSDNVIIMAINEAVNYNAKTIKYISKVLNNWISKGIKTAEQVIAYQKQWTSNNNSETRQHKSSSFCDYKQRTYDFDLLEKQLLGIA